MFSGSHNLIVNGKNLTNITNYYTNTVPPPTPRAFRKIQLGDIYLKQEMGAPTVSRRRGQRFIRRVYSAEIEGRKSNMTVAVYEGDAAEEEWLERIEQDSWLRMYAAISYGGEAVKVRTGNPISDRD
ncbi:hypothetical protein B0H19DRAFT_1063402 [Mycena capillaripes]|nr:hypothetical protein B0H19DRAFT_1063402 [Mycena capillaripes]